ncbi:hypothetical protein HZC07_05665 [Candidatus Micrarchaeota archaeon]|nr:hypothetical protein [Candidatus Micrarchaeota archaeon]
MKPTKRKQYFAILKEKKALEKEQETTVLNFLFKNTDRIKLLRIGNEKNQNVIRTREELKKDLIGKEEKIAKGLIWTSKTEHYIYKLSKNLRSRFDSEGLFFFNPDIGDFAGFQAEGSFFYNKDELVVEVNCPACRDIILYLTEKERKELLAKGIELTEQTEENSS